MTAQAYGVPGLPERVRIYEVGPRDGLQNESVSLSIEDRVVFCDRLIAAGLPVVEVGAFVSPKWVPQMAGSGEVLRRVAKPMGVRLPVLVPNRQGYDQARTAGAREIAVFTAASETFNRKNINATIAESIERFKPVVAGARAAGLPVRGYVSTAFYCPYEGAISPAQVMPVVEALVELGIDDISIGDTIGKAVPADVHALLDRLLPAVAASRIALHFHDTYGLAVENVLAGHARGVRTFDASAGGLGGCPYAPGAAGNVATEAVVAALRAAGAEVPVDLAALAAARAVIWPAIGRNVV
jgi:hydroxymethylglutaryl-CoA lyase